MLFKSTTFHVRCVLYSQVALVASLVSMGLLLLIGSAASFRYIYWSCPVLNVYYSVSWLCLTLGIVQVLLGSVIAILLYVQPRCAKQSNLVLIGPEGNTLGEITESPNHGIQRKYWTLRLSSNHPNPPGGCCCCCYCWRSRFCCCCNGDDQSVPCDITAWFRPLAISFVLIVVGHIVAIFLVTSFISRAENPAYGLMTEVESIFIEAKSYFLQSTSTTSISSAAKCWLPMESTRHCCGSLGAQDWLSDYPANETLLLQNQLIILQERCSCSKEEKGICESQNLQFPSNKTENALIYSRGCRSVIHDDIIFDLNVFRFLVPFSFTLVFVTCLASVIVTLLVANLELRDKETATRSVSTIITSQSFSIPDESGIIPKSTMDRKGTPFVPNLLSDVAGPALRTLSSYDPLNDVKS